MTILLNNTVTTDTRHKVSQVKNNSFEVEKELDEEPPIDLHPQHLDQQNFRG